jgi:hypothetical protein
LRVSGFGPVFAGCFFVGLRMVWGGRSQKAVAGRSRSTSFSEAAEKVRMKSALGDG